MRASRYDKNQEIKQLCQWLSHQLTNHKKKSYIMLDETIYNTFWNFLSEYEEYFKSNDEILDQMSIVSKPKITSNQIKST